LRVGGPPYKDITGITEMKYTPEKLDSNDKNVHMQRSDGVVLT